MTAPQLDSRLVSLYERHFDEILAYCVRRVGFEDAEEAAAEVFVVAWRRIDEIDPPSARAYLYGIARNVLANRWRSIRRRRRLHSRIEEVVGREAPQAAADALVVGGESDLVMRALTRLRAADREILRLAAWEDLATAEIATALGISIQAAEQRLHRAKRRFADALDRLSPADTRFKRAANHEGGG